MRKSKPIILCPTCIELINTQKPFENMCDDIENESNNFDENNCPDSRFTALINRGGLFFVSPKIFQYILDIEALLPKLIKSNFQSNKFLKCVCDQLSVKISHNLPICCNLPNLVLKRTVLILTHKYLSSVYIYSYLGLCVKLSLYFWW